MMRDLLRCRFRPWAVILFYLFPSPGVASSEVVELASGPKDGVYHRLAEGIQRRLEKADIEVRIDPTFDCVESLNRVEGRTGMEDSSVVRFAFAQQDVVAERFRNSPGTTLRVVDRIAFDYLHIFVRESLRADSVADLTGRNIWIGENRSATRFTAVHFLDVLGARLENIATFEELENRRWTSNDLLVETYAVRELRNWLGEGRLDAAMLVAPLGAPQVVDVMRYGRSRLLSLDPITRRKLLGSRENHSFLRHVVFGTLPKWSYDYQDTEISTIAVPVLLVSDQETSSDLASMVRDATLDEWNAMQAGLRRNQTWRSSAAATDVEPLTTFGLKLLPGIERDDSPPMRIPPWGHGLFALVVVGVMLALLKQRRLRRLALSAWHHYPLLCGVSLPLLLGVPLITWFTYLAERDINENFSSFWKSGWSITIYIFSGLEDRVPYTLAGHLLVTAGLLLGWICSAVATGWTAGIFVRRNRKMSRSLEDHFLLLNWNERGIDLVRELHHEVLVKGNRTAPIVVLTDEEAPCLKQLTRLGDGRAEAFDDVFACFGDPTDEAALKRANARSARAVIILANGKHGDERTIRSILALHRIASVPPKQDLHVVAELIEPGNDRVLKHLDEGFPGRIESVSGPRLRTCLLSQTALTKGITGFYTDLLSVERGTNELYAEPIPASAIDKSFREYAALVVEKSKSPVIPVGVHRTVNGKAEVYTNPKQGKEGAILKEGDKLVLIAYGPPEENTMPVPETSSTSEPEPAPIPLADQCLAARS